MGCHGQKHRPYARHGCVSLLLSEAVPLALVEVFGSRMIIAIDVSLKYDC